MINIQSERHNNKTGDANSDGNNLAPALNSLESLGLQKVPFTHNFAHSRRKSHKFNNLSHTESGILLVDQTHAMRLIRQTLAGPHSFTIATMQ